MKHIRYLLTLLMVFAMIAAACGGGDDDGGDDAAEDTSTEDSADDSSDDGDDEAMDEDDGDDEAMAEGGEVLTDFGVDAENKVIKVGLNADLSGPFASLVSEIVAAQEVYWEVFNDEGGYEGWTVETVTIDSGYQTDVGIQNYEQLAQESEDGVLMITENTGSPITAAIAEQAAEDNVLVIPLSWASLWPDPEFGAAILEKQTTYCIESMNGVEWLKGYVEEQGLEPSLAILSRPGEYGEDGAAGAKLVAEELGIPVVYDGTSAGCRRRPHRLSSRRSGRLGCHHGVHHADAGRDCSTSSATPSRRASRVTGPATAPSFNYLVHAVERLRRPVRPVLLPVAVSGTLGHTGYSRVWRPSSPRCRPVGPDLNISDVYTTGWIEGMMAEALDSSRAIDDGDLTRAQHGRDLAGSVVPRGRASTAFRPTQSWAGELQRRCGPFELGSTTSTPRRSTSSRLAKSTPDNARQHSGLIPVRPGLRRIGGGRATSSMDRASRPAA